MAVVTPLQSMRSEWYEAMARVRRCRTRNYDWPQLWVSGCVQYSRILGPNGVFTVGDIGCAG
jgi:hypothetical protein